MYNNSAKIAKSDGAKSNEYDEWIRHNTTFSILIFRVCNDILYMMWNNLSLLASPD